MTKADNSWSCLCILYIILSTLFLSVLLDDWQITKSWDHMGFKTLQYMCNFFIHLKQCKRNFSTKQKNAKQVCIVLVQLTKNNWKEFFFHWKELMWGIWSGRTVKTLPSFIYWSSSHTSSLHDQSLLKCSSVHLSARDGSDWYLWQFKRY